MRGSWLASGLVSGLFLAVLSSCNNTAAENLPDAPQIVIFPNQQLFGTDQGLGTTIGTSPNQSFKISNEGKQTLIISSVTKSGSSAFIITGPNAGDGSSDGGVLESKETSFLQVVFKPTQPIQYTGKLTFKSNAGGAQLLALDGGFTTPADPTSIDIPLAGFGVLPPDAGPDGG